jgi:hypothetical protein
VLEKVFLPFQASDMWQEVLGMAFVLFSSVEGIMFDLGISSTDKAVKQLFTDSGGILLSHCLSQNLVLLLLLLPLVFQCVLSLCLRL